MTREQDRGAPFVAGDLVEATKGERRRTERLEAIVRDGRPDLLAFPGLGAIVDARRDGWTLTVREPAVAPLPTKAGLYVDRTGWSVWHIISDGGRLECPRAPGYDPDRYRPFVKLEPVPVTVQKIARRLEAGFEFGLAAIIRDEFGGPE